MQEITPNTGYKTGNTQIDNVAQKSKEEHIDNFENQISIEFDSSFCSLKEEEQEEINRILGDQQVKARVYFIRHGQSIEDKGTQNIQSSEAKLTEKAKQQFKEIGEDLKKQGLTSKNTYLLYHDGDKVPMQRIIESAKIIKTSLRLEDKKVDNRVKGTDTTDKEIENQTERYVATAEEVIIFCKEMVSKLEGKENINIICVVHKSNIGAIRQYFFKEENKPVDLGHGNMKNGEIQELDFTMEEKVLNYDVDKTILSINSYNYDSGLLEILEKEEGLRSYITRFRKGELQIWELQNLVNLYFIRNGSTNLFEKYLLSGNRELRIFCIANLLIDGGFEIVDKNMEVLLEKEKENMIVDFVDTILSVCTEEERKTLLKIIVNKRGILSGLKLGKLEYYANYEKYVKENIKDIRNKSLDEKLKAGEDIIISLGFQGRTTKFIDIGDSSNLCLEDLENNAIGINKLSEVIEKLTSNETRIPLFFIEEEKYQNIEELLVSKRIVLIEGEAGAGKSVKLLEIMEYLNPNDDGENRYFPVYVNLGEFSYKRLSGEIERQISNLYGKGKYKFVYLFDALDEAKYTDKVQKVFFEKITELRNNGGKIIITSRNNTLSKELSDLEKENMIDIEKTYLEPLNKKQIEEYIDTHLSETQQRIWEEWKKKNFIKGIEDNPLMLSIICSLLVLGEYIEDIDNIAKLYEKIVDSRLKNWEENKPQREVNKNKIPFRKKLLSHIAYDSLVLEKEIDYEYITKIIESDDNYKQAIPYVEETGYDLKCLNIIKRNNEGVYSFIHESFREYFFYIKYSNNKKKYLKLLDMDLKQGNTTIYDTLNSLILFDDNGLGILEKVIKLEGFQNHFIAMEKTCGLIEEIGGKEGLAILEKIIELEGFQKIKFLIYRVCNILKQIGGKEGLAILEKIIEIEGFQNSGDSISFSCFLIGEIGEKEGLAILERIIELDIFRINYDFLLPDYSDISKNDWRNKLGSILELDKIEKTKNAITNACWAIAVIGKIEGLVILEKIIKLEGFQNNKEAITNACVAIGNIGLEEGIRLFEKIVELKGFQNLENHFKQKIKEFLEKSQENSEKKTKENIQKLIELI